MLISKFSKNGKSGFAVGTNALTREKLAAGAITLAAGLLISAIGGILRIKKPEKAKKASEKGEKKGRPIWLALMPFIFNAVKTKIQNNFLNNLTSQAAEAAEANNVPVAEEDGVEVIQGENLSQGLDGIEVMDAIPISSEDEVYQHI